MNQIKPNAFYISNYHKNHLLTEFYLDSVRRSLLYLNSDYPDFIEWFNIKVVPNLSSEREIIITTCDKYISGIAILKQNAQESKICTLRVVPRFQSMGIGSFLLELSMKKLNTIYPYITIPSYKLPEFQNIFAKYGFKKEDEVRGLYHSNVSELCFNHSWI